MMASDLSMASARNLRRTYFALGRATPGSVYLEEEGFESCICDIEHPISNFAANLKVDPWVAGRLVEIALTRPTYNVYGMDGDSPGDRDRRNEVLVRAGFRNSYQLRQMWCPPYPTESTLELTSIHGPAARSEIASFMANLFFPKYSSWFRSRVSEATTGATDLQLHAVYHRESLIGALMLVEDEEVIGLYNLCVKPQYQNLGWGAAIVSEVRRQAYERNKHVALQCDQSLVTWYERQGFASGGAIDVYALSDERRAAIMN